MKPLISVIIPVYNVEQYIVECLESVRVQTFHDYEVIIVNDGTKDRSAELTANFIKEHGLANWCIVDKENGGLSSARNAGMDVARGDWIFFVDSDDWIEPKALEVLTDCLRRNPADLVIGGYQAYDQTTGTTEVWSDYPCDFGVMPRDLGKLHSFSMCWGRLYKKTIIDQHSLRFDERIQYAEDNPWQFDYIQRISAFSCTNQVIYNYRINRAGALTSQHVTPRMKYHNAEYMYRFYATVDKQLAADSLKENPRLLSVTWGVLTTNVVNHILDNEYSTARKKIHSELSRAVITAFAPRSKKEKIFLWLWKYSFVLLCAFVKVYYGNFETLHKSKLLQVLSKRK